LTWGFRLTPENPSANSWKNSAR